MRPCGRVTRRRGRTAVFLRAQPLQDVGLDQVLRVDRAVLAGIAGQIDARRRGRKRWEIRVGMALAVVAELVVEPVPERTARRVEHPHPPLAHHGGGVARAQQHLRHRDRSGRQRQLALGLNFPVAAHRRVAGVQAGHQRGPRRRAHTRAAVGLRVARAFARHAIEARGLDQLLTVNADVTLREIVAEDEDDVR